MRRSSTYISNQQSGTYINNYYIKTDQSEAFIPTPFQASSNTTLLLHQVISELL